MKQKTKSLSSYFTLLALFMGVGMLIAFAVYYSYGVRKMTLREGDVYIPSGSTLSQQAAVLIDEGFLEDTSTYLTFARKMGYDKVRPGRYTLRSGMTLRELNLLIGAGRQSSVRVSFNNIRTREKLSGVVSKYIEADSAELMRVFTSDSIYKKYGVTEATFLSLFIPNTYELYWSTTAEGFVARMKKEYDTFWSKDSRQKALKELGMSQAEVSILASIVIEESKAEKEFKRIAGVYINRLKRGMLLQADPTVKFALGDPTIKRVLYKHLEVDSPYNTYKYAGLPPGVLCVPPISAIDAVLGYEKHGYYYFCASPELNGLHRFATNLTQHNQNARQYAAALNRMGVR